MSDAGTRGKCPFLGGPRVLVTGIGLVGETINRARRKAVERGSTATFRVKDALPLKHWSERFDT